MGLPREVTRLELMLEDASIKLSSVAASLTSVIAHRTPSLSQGIPFVGCS